MPLVLYSAHTWIAYKIAQRFYRQIHHAWCAPQTDPEFAADRDAMVPPSSSPFGIYRTLQEAVDNGDQHCLKIKDNRVGMLRGASERREQRVIDDDQYNRIAEAVDRAETADYRPLMFVIPYDGVSDLVKEVPLDGSAHPLSSEYIIENLPRQLFDVVRFV